LLCLSCWPGRTLLALGNGTGFASHIWTVTMLPLFLVKDNHNNDLVGSGLDAKRGPLREASFG
jgi:hypothetical protein